MERTSCFDAFDYSLAVKPRLRFKVTGPMLNFPNRSRIFDPARRAVRFGLLQRDRMAFFVNEGALKPPPNLGRFRFVVSSASCRLNTARAIKITLKTSLRKYRTAIVSGKRRCRGCRRGALPQPALAPRPAAPVAARHWPAGLVAGYRAGPTAYMCLAGAARSASAPCLNPGRERTASVSDTATMMLPHFLSLLESPLRWVDAAAPEY